MEDTFSFVILIPDEQQPLSPEQVLLTPLSFNDMPAVPMAWLGRCKKIVVTDDEFRKFLDEAQAGRGPARFYVERY